MATIPAIQSVPFFADAGGAAVALSTAQTGSGDSTNVAFRGQRQTGGAVVVTSTIGATPTVTVNIQGSVDGTAWFNVPYSLVATPRTFVLTAITITTAVTTTYLLQELVSWQYLKLALSANTNVTLTATAYL
ncbi:MAG TPA: hypothetical protein VK595_13335 [Vicinamibacterales bacterium]|nr:hypothetical protein [Vicinamibacterales bacterium]